MISGVVLCGGAGSRMGGADKPLLELAGRPLISHVLERLTPQVDEVVISANRHRDAYAALGMPVVADAVAGQGPLAGIAAAAPVCRGELLFFCPGDAPALGRDLVAQLAARLREGGRTAEAVVAHDGIRDQVLFLLARRQAVGSVAGYLTAGGRSVHRWLETLHILRCPIGEPAQFANVNSTEDLAALESRWPSRAP